jgi:hypothetical protein
MGVVQFTVWGEQVGFLYEVIWLFYGVNNEGYYMFLIQITVWGEQVGLLYRGNTGYCMG